MALLSILTPYKNAGSFLEECVYSVLNQSFTDWEWILVNDESKDNSLEILEAFAKADERFMLLTNPEKGILPALQFGLKHCKGGFITRMDADDIMPQGRLQLMVETLQKSPPKTIVTGKVRYISLNPISEGYQKYERWLNQRIKQADHWKHIYRECVIASPNWMMHTSELLAINVFDDLEYPEDYDLCFKWYAHYFHIIGLPNITLHWREHEARTSRNSENYQQPAFFSLKLKRFLMLDYQKDKPLILMGEGVKANLAATFLAAHKIPIMQMVQTEKARNQHSIVHTDALSDYKHAQILIAIYPDKAKRKALENWLATFNFILGTNYWYL